MTEILGKRLQTRLKVLEDLIREVDRKYKGKDEKFLRAYIEEHKKIFEEARGNRTTITTFSFLVVLLPPSSIIGPMIRPKVPRIIGIDVMINVKKIRTLM